MTDTNDMAKAIAFAGQVSRRMRKAGWTVLYANDRLAVGGLRVTAVSGSEAQVYGHYEEATAAADAMRGVPQALKDLGYSVREIGATTVAVTPREASIHQGKSSDLTVTDTTVQAKVDRLRTEAETALVAAGDKVVLLRAAITEARAEIEPEAWSEQIAALTLDWCATQIAARVHEGRLALAIMSAPVQLRLDAMKPDVRDGE